MTVGQLILPQTLTSVCSVVINTSFKIPLLQDELPVLAVVQGLEDYTEKYGGSFGVGWVFLFCVYFAYQNK